MKKILLLLAVMIIVLPVSVSAAPTLYDINQKICTRFEDDVLKLAAIMEELRRRRGITETRVAFGGIDSPIKTADYWVTYAAEAIAFQRNQAYSSKNALKASLEVLKNKILRAKTEVGRAL